MLPRQAENINHIQSTARKPTKTPLGGTTPHTAVNYTVFVLMSGAVIQEAEEDP